MAYARVLSPPAHHIGGTMTDTMTDTLAAEMWSGSAVPHNSRLARP